MRTIKMTMLLTLIVLFMPLVNNAQEISATMDFENAEANVAVVSNYVNAVQNGDVETMVAQLAGDAKIYGLNEVFTDAMNPSQLSEYYKASFATSKHSIDPNTSYAPIKVTGGINEGEWVMVWTTDTISSKKTGQEIAIPAQVTCVVEDGKIKMMAHYYDQLNVMTSMGYTLQPPTE
ncbi:MULTISPECIES: nuclear transport factor 2 family protein [Maribacter]|uniref:SnoaL-like domain-containing protein n=1 Tax=Maribacter stanieri TaxID=440514 RepID=A0A1I6HPM6_9FLAO|nr:MULTISPECIES: nuclear transport factor 2 family protein [Maribacter]SFR56441.1 SnoaL-like domain-containing protein [Maribacter stanieri]